MGERGGPAPRGLSNKQSFFDREAWGWDPPSRNRPARQADHEDEPEEVDGSDSSGDDDHEDQPWNRQDDVVEAHHDLVDPSSQITGYEPNGRPQDACDHRGEDPDDKTDLGPPNDL